jgi:hypothetical protein
MIDLDGIAVLEAFEGLETMSTGMDARRAFIKKGLTQQKVDNAAIAGTKRAGGGGGGGGSGGTAAKKGKNNSGGANKNGGGKKAYEKKADDGRVCFTCGKKGHVARDCHQKKG